MGDEHYLISPPPPAPLTTQPVPPQIPFEAVLGIIQGIISLNLFTGDEHYPRFLPSTLQRRQKSSHSKRAQLWIILNKWMYKDTSNYLWDISNSRHFFRWIFQALFWLPVYSRGHTKHRLVKISYTVSKHLDGFESVFQAYCSVP